MGRIGTKRELESHGGVLLGLRLGLAPTMHHSQRFGHLRRAPLPNTEDNVFGPKLPFIKLLGGQDA